MLFGRLLAEAVLACIRKNVKKQEANMNENNFYVCQSRIVFRMVVAFSLFLSILLVFFLVQKDTPVWQYTLVVIGIAFLGVEVLANCTFWKMEVDNEQIFIKKMFLSKKEYCFRNIEEVIIKKDYSNEMILCSHNKKLLNVQSGYIGYEILLSRLEKENIKIEYI